MKDVVSEYFTQKKLFCPKHPNIMCTCERKHIYNNKTIYKLCEDHYMQYEEYMDSCGIIEKVYLKIIGRIYPKSMPVKLHWYNNSLCTACRALDEDDDSDDDSSLEYTDM